MKFILSWMLVLATGIVLYASDNSQNEPRVIKRVDPKYPSILKAAGIQGEVEVKVTVDGKGAVVDVELIKSSNPDFVPATIEAAKQWVFSPATNDGVPVKSEITIPFKFKLGPDSYPSDHEDILRLEDNAVRILRGEGTDGLTSFIDVQANVVVGKEIKNLRSLSVDKASPSILAEGKATEVEWSQLITNDANDAAFLTLKTRPAPGNPGRVHTIVFMQNSAGKWHLMTWHVSQ